MTERPVLLIGLDGVDVRYLDEFRGSLPTITDAREAGVAAPLRSGHPPWTGSAWPSLYTGVDASHHGVFDFFDYTDAYPDEASVVTRQSVEAPAVWDYLTHAGDRSIVVNVPVTHPPADIDGLLVPGYLAPDEPETHPSGLGDELASALGEPYQVYSEHETAADTEQKVRGYESLLAHRGEAAAYLLDAHDWDFAFVQFQKTDAVFHNSSSRHDFERIYRAADRAISRLLDACSREPNFVVCSDHGIGPVTGYTFFVNEFLRGEGYVEATPEDTAVELGAVKSETGGGSAGSALVGKLSAMGRPVGLTPGNVYRAAQRLGVGSHLEAVVPDSVRRSVSQGVDWRESAAYCRTESEQGVRINLAGRDPAGVVPASEYETVRSDLIDLLSSVETPDGKPVFEYVRPREAVYDGPFTEDACDILFQTVDMNHTVSPKLYGRTFTPCDSYNHKRDGIFVAAGPDIPDEWAVEELSLLDVAPIVFALLGRPVPERLAGSIPEAIDSSPASSPYDGLDYGGSGSYSQDQTAVTDRLSDLGYL